jgi:GT2 family glycosyltransferase
VFLLVGRLDCGQDGSVPAWLKDGNEVTEIGARALSCVSPYQASEGGDGRVTVILLVGPNRLLTSPGSLVLETARGEQVLDIPRIRSRLSDLKTLCRDGLAGLPAQTRNQITDFLATSAGEMDAGTLEVSKSLGQVRDALRKGFPVYEPKPDKQRGVWVDNIMAVDDRSFYVQGWLRDEEGEVVRLTAVSPEGNRVELYKKLFRTSRPDVAKLFETLREDENLDAELGFVCFFKTPVPSLLRTGWVLEMENAAGVAVEAATPAVVRGPAKVRDMILGDPARQRHLPEQLMTTHVFPAVNRIQEKLAAEATTKAVVQFGDPPPRPKASLIIPIYQRVEHLEMQLAEFADDRDMHEADLIYVLDSPEDADSFLHGAENIFPIYRVPFRIAFMRANAGFGGANNTGASLARGSLLLFMNSDILPDGPGWLRAMSDFYESTPRCGVLGPKLVYADDTIQHAGMRLFQPIGAPRSAIWLDDHYFKTLHRSFPPANVTRVVPAISGACSMISHELYKEVGGFRGIYVRGDYEDYDLCWRVMEKGYDNWYLADVELYHLESQSYPSELRSVSNRYNAWLHSHLWRDRIERVMDHFDSAVHAGEPNSGHRSRAPLKSHS